ncbi:2-hydroxyacid dehydrogenase [Maritalea porphyrae]|uniref:2-hydroxyacid dehydrogenase n=1 Tax=Maritalea porphyrae TaxID=880732 RepID=UPI0022B01B55|nr:glyoxylate/hydroxypyruvate reductase A [Maritalea porphyrae]MCZ4271718.1 glyoxylate/hydroxypyruvate reductase A [Maritalea porphyrae]
MTFLMHLSDVSEREWANAFQKALPNHKVVTRQDQYSPVEIKYLYVWKPEADAFDGLDHLEVIFSLGAGVDSIVKHPKLPRGVPVVRFVDDTLTQCMSDYVVANVTMHHRQATRYKREQAQRKWDQYYPERASTINVGIMGLGQLGKDAAQKLSMLGYNVAGWSRNPKCIAGIEEFSGTAKFDEFLSRTDILVCLLPLTPETQDILCMENFSKLRRGHLPGGPCIVNAARGGHQNEDDIVAALKGGTLAAASLDVFKVEPLPTSSELWALDNCYITPHIAAISGLEAGVRLVTSQINSYEQSGELKHLVDVERGY